MHTLTSRSLTSLLAVTAVSALGLAACGDNADNPGTPDAGPDAPAGTPVTRAVIVTGDFNPGSPGVLSALDVTGGTAGTPDVNAAPAGAIGEDPVLRHVDGELIVINRASGNNVTILDDRTFALVAQLGAGAGANPQDAAVIGDTVFVATFGGKGLVALTRGSSTVTEIDLSADDPDGKPNCASVYRVGNSLYVACGLLDDTQQFLPPRGPGKVYVVDVGSRAITATLTLSTNNPIALLEQVPAGSTYAGDLLLPTMDFGTGAGCVERISTGATPAAEGCVVENAELGNFAGRISVFATEFTGPAQGIVVPPMMYAAVPKPDFSGSDLVTFDLASETLTVAEVAGSTSDVVACPDGTVVLADGTMAASGLRVYPSGATGAPINVGLRPQSTHGLVCYEVTP